MTIRTNARIAGVVFLLYIAAGVSSMIVYPHGVPGIAGKLAAIAAHPATMGAVVLLGFVQSSCAIVLAVTLYALTRNEDRDLALLAMVCRVIEGTMGALSVLTTTAVVPLAASANDASVQVLARYLLHNDVAVTATFFAAGSLLFAILFLRGRMIPVVLAWIGVAASVILVIWLPLEAAGFLQPAFAVWLPMLAFEVPLAIWLIAKGVASEAH